MELAAVVVGFPLRTIAGAARVPDLAEPLRRIILCGIAVELIGQYLPLSRLGDSVVIGVKPRRERAKVFLGDRG